MLRLPSRYGLGQATTGRPPNSMVDGPAPGSSTARPDETSIGLPPPSPLSGTFRLPPFGLLGPPFPVGGWPRLTPARNDEQWSIMYCASAIMMLAAVASMPLP